MSTLKPLRRNSVLTLSSSNLFALERVESELVDKQRASVITRQPAFHDEPSKESIQKYVEVLEISQNELLKQYLVADFWNNLTIVTLPACFTNFIWRLMNLYGIAVSHNFWNIIGETTWEIATIVFILCFIIDAIRQMTLYQKQFKYDEFSEIFKAYYKNWGALSSCHLAFKFFMACVFWTIGYALIADDHQIYTDKSDITLAIYRALGAGVGSFFGLIIASEIIALTEYHSGLLVSLTKQEPYSMNKVQSTKRKGFFLDTNQKGIFGVGFKGFCEGIAWSIVGDIDLYLLMKDKGFGDNSAFILDSLTVGIFASLWFTFGGFYTSLLGYCEQRTTNWKRKRKESQIRRSHERDESIFDDAMTPDIPGTDGDCGSTVSSLESGETHEEYQPLL